MASKDVLDQIRDLQSFIDDFAADAGTMSPTVDEKTELAEPLNENTILQKPDEKTEVEADEEKTLVEQQPLLSILSYDLNLSDDFSSLLTQFKDIKMSPVDIKSVQKQQQQQELIAEQEKKEKVQVEIPTTIEKQPVDTPNSFLTQSPHYTTKPRSRRTSESSKRSQKSGKSMKSIKSAKSTRSARRLLNEKKLQQQNQQPKQLPSMNSTNQKYVERTYDEMMRIPDIYERLAFYEKTLDLCLKADSPITNWIKQNTAKGKLEEIQHEYVPSIQILSPDLPPISDNHAFGSMNTTFSGSISTFLKKAGGKQLENKSFISSPHMHNSGSGLFGRSMSRLNLSRSTQIQSRYDSQPPSRYENMIRTPLATRGISMAATNSPMKIQSPMSPSPLNMNFHLSTPRSSSSTPTSFGSTTTITSQGEFQNQSAALNYMVNVLPQIDINILQSALDEAKGDAMVAISIAVSKNKAMSNMQHGHKRLSAAAIKKSSKHYTKIK